MSARHQRVRRPRSNHHSAKRTSRLTPTPHPSPRAARRLSGHSDFRVFFSPDALSRLTASTGIAANRQPPTANPP
ncbi:hypothetical protein, partial [Burkholderia multivorans]